MKAIAATRRNLIPQMIAVFAAFSMAFAFPSWAYTPSDAAESPVVLTLFTMLVIGLIVRAYQHNRAEAQN